MCIKGFVNRLSHDSDLDIERDVSTAYCRSSSGDRVDLLSRTICSTVVVSSGMVAGFRTIKVLLALSEEEKCALSGPQWHSPLTDLYLL